MPDHSSPADTNPESRPSTDTTAPLTELSAEATRRGTEWIVRLREAPNVVATARRLDQAEAAIRDALTLMPSPVADPRTADINVVVNGEMESRACSARDRLQHLRQQERRQKQHIATIARELAETGYTYRDIAYLLGITYGRVGQILASD